MANRRKKRLNNKIGKQDEEIRTNVVRINVKTSSGDKQWKNVEITGYAKVVEADPPNDSVDWYARGNRHNNNVPCKGTASHGGLHID
jgi:hypothetical protein